MNLYNKLGKSLQSGMVYRAFTIQPKYTADFGQSRKQGTGSALQGGGDG